MFFAKWKFWGLMRLVANDGAGCNLLRMLQGAGTQVTREMETQALITALALPYGGKILFAATELGVVRCYKYPLTGVRLLRACLLLECDPAAMLSGQWWIGG